MSTMPQKSIFIHFPWYLLQTYSNPSPPPPPRCFSFKTSRFFAKNKLVVSEVPHSKESVPQSEWSHHNVSLLHPGSSLISQTVPAANARHPGRFGKWTTGRVSFCWWVFNVNPFRKHMRWTVKLEIFPKIGVNVWGNWKEFSFGDFSSMGNYTGRGIHLAGHKSLEITLSMILTLSPLERGRDPKGNNRLPTNYPFSGAMFDKSYKMDPGSGYEWGYKPYEYSCNPSYQFLLALYRGYNPI